MAKPEIKKHKLSEAALEIVAERFKVLSEAARLRLLLNLQEGEKAVSELSAGTGLSQPNVSRHLSKLLDAGIIERRKEGTCVFYRIADPDIFKLCGSVCSSIRKDLDRREKALK